MNIYNTSFTSSHAITLTYTHYLPTCTGTKTGNEEYEKEKVAKELRKKRAEGVAPWGFDDVKGR